MIYDLIIIGAGPGGYAAAVSAAKKNKKVLVIDRNELGGTCLNTGCIPSNYYYQTALFHYKYNQLKEKNIAQGNLHINFPELVKNKNNLVLKLRKGIEYLFKKNNVEYIKGEGKIIPLNRVKVIKDKSEKIYETEKILIATGSNEVIPDMIKGVEFYTGESIWNMPQLPEKLAIFGGGVVGTEIALIFSQLGVKVYVFELLDSILSFLDEDIISPIIKTLKKKGVEIFTHFSIQSIQKIDKEIKIIGKENLEIRADQIVVSVGRKPNINCLEKNVNLNLKNEFIQVNENYETSIKNIYALGDVINQGKMFAHLAMFQAHDFTEKVYDKKYHQRKNPVFIPYGIYTIPEIAGVGQTEKELVRFHIPYKIKKVNSISTSMGKILDIKNGFTKIIFDEHEKRILGIHIVSEKATELISVMSYIMNNQLQDKISFLHRAIFLHPSESELFSENILKEK